MVLTDVVLTLCIRRSLAEWVLRRDGRSAARAAADGAIDGFIVLGPTFVKLGQIMASSSGLFPEPLPSAARRCLDEVPPFGADEVRRMIAADLGRPPNQIFTDFDPTPLPAASTGPVHACPPPHGRAAWGKLPPLGSRRSR